MPALESNGRDSLEGLRPGSIPVVYELRGKTRCVESTYSTLAGKAATPRLVCNLQEKATLHARARVRGCVLILNKRGPIGLQSACFRGDKVAEHNYSTMKSSENTGIYASKFAFKDNNGKLSVFQVLKRFLSANFA